MSTSILLLSPTHMHTHTYHPHPLTPHTQCILRTLLVLLTGLIMICVPDFSTIMALVGSSCCTLLAFILPGIFHWKLFKTWAQPNPWQSYVLFHQLLAELLEFADRSALHGHLIKVYCLCFYKYKTGAPLFETWAHQTFANLMTCLIYW